MKLLFPLTLAALVVPGVGFAQSSDHAMHHAPVVDAAQGPASEGEVRKIDPAQGKITLRHGPIVNLDMPAMTMVFRVADPALLEGVQAGDKVRFAADNVQGVLTVTALQVQR